MRRNRNNNIIAEPWETWTNKENGTHQFLESWRIFFKIIQVF